VENIKSALKSTYFSPFGFRDFFYFGGGNIGVFFQTNSKSYKVADAKELALKKYFSKFLTENPKADENFKVWKEKQ
jgi:hypothetical protein